ncbi:MAG TPA: type III-A CRISPR-associated protein Cas10/Csm1 [Spirochaetota bacterium]|nr:type III-A CRISPR-associated protein Cas10/Csm1 [Spirochaetota bacterium]
MNNDNYEVLLAALLHDIGKFKQRACGGREPSGFPVEMEGIILPKAQGQRYSHRHALWTFHFFEREFAGVDLPRGLDRNRIRDLASRHHNSSNEYERFIERADRLSAAGDRLTDDRAHYERSEYLKKPLAPVFPLVSLGGNPTPARDYSYPLLPLDGRGIFPVKGKGGASLEKEYGALWDGFTAGLASLPGDGSAPEQFTQTLVSLLERFTWCIPSATNDKYCDISLYDHAVTTASIALVLKLYAEGGGADSDEKPFLFFGADLSGIQQFIFQNQRESFRGSAKVIRGRSFYVAVTAQAYFLALCDALGIPPFTRLLDSGGKFTMVLPNLPGFRERAERFFARADEWFFMRFHGEFTVVHDLSVTAGEDEMGQKKFCELVSRINFNLAQAKSAKFSFILKRGECVIPVEYSERELCRACGRFPKNSDAENARCDHCDELFTLGEGLTRNTVLEFRRSGGGHVHFFDGAIGVSLGPAGRASGAFLSYSLTDSGDGMPVFHLNAHVPRKTDGGTMSFEEIAEAAVRPDKIKDRETRAGVDLLAYIKIDVDNLGNIFGFGIDELSVSRYVSLSRMLHLFFNLVVKNILVERFPEFYTVLSGGDDLFVIGPWDRCTDFLDEVQRSFESFVCDNPDVHFSAGVVLQHPRFPMSKAAGLTDRAIDEAKDGGRNRVHFITGMGYDEMREMAEKAQWLKERARDVNSRIGHAFLYRLLKYVRMAERVRGRSTRGSGEKVFAPDLMYIPRFRYDVARNVAVKSAGELVNGSEVCALVDLFDRYSRENPGLLRAACTVALYQLREQSPHKEACDDSAD